MKAVFSSEREVQNRLQLIKYKGGNGEFHSHSQIEICIVDSGKLNAHVGKNCKLLKEGEVAVSLSFETHAYLPVGSADFTVLIIPSNITENFISHVKHKAISSPFICNSEDADKIREYIDKINAADPLGQVGYTYLLLSRVAENLLVSSTDSSAETELLSKLIGYIHDNFKNDISLSDIAEHFGYNKSYISRYFGENFGIGIVRYLNIIRLKCAIEMIREGELDIAFCALDSGFNSVRTFYRVFQSEFGCSPKEYIKNF